MSGPADIVETVGADVDLTTVGGGRAKRGTCPRCGTPRLFVLLRRQVFFCYDCTEGGDASTWARFRGVLA